MAKAKSSTKTPTVVEVLEPEPADVALVAAESIGIVDWLHGLGTFFRTSQQIERAAVARLERVRTLPVPTTKEQDAAIRQEVIDARDARKAATAHWEVITSALSKLHRMTTAGRARATDPLEQVEKLGTGLHTRYVDAEKRRAADAAEVERRKLEAQAQLDRDTRLAEFEAAAVAAEESSPELSAREDKFVTFHCGISADGTQRGGQQTALAAAMAAGYAKPNEQAPRLIASDKIRAAIDARMRAHTMRTQIEVMREMAPFVDEGAIEEAAKPQLNSGDREQWSASVLDLETFRNAAFDGGMGIPREIFNVDAAELNRAARSLGKNVERWPGIKATKNTTVLR
jgi:hypothetical protein